MAEVFGVVVSALTVAGMVSKFSTSIFKLNRLWDEVQDAPADISQRIRQLAVVKPILEEMESGLRDGKHQVRHGSAAGLSMEYCQQAVNELELLAEDLQGRISKAKRSRAFAKLKAVLKKDVLQGYQERIQFALQLLALSQQTYIIALVKNNSGAGSPAQCSLHEAGSAQITAKDDHPQCTESTSSADGNVDTLSIHGCRRKSSSLVWLKPSVFGGFTYTASTHEKDSKTLVYEARVQLPWWLSNKIWDLEAYRACQGWKFSISPWITRPGNAPIFRHAKRGSWADVRDALDRNQATLRDRNPNGWTLLHIAAFSGNIDVVVNLIKLGLSTHEKTAEGFRVLLTLILSEPSAEDVGRVVRMLASSGSLDEYFPLVFQRPSEHDTTPSVRGIIASLVWKFRGVLQIMAAEFQADPSQLPLDARFGSLDWCCADPDLLLEEFSRGRDVDAASLRAVLCGPDDNNLNAFAEAYFFGVNGKALIRGYYWAFDRHVGTEPRINSWRKLARRILPAVSLEDLVQSVPVQGRPTHDLSPLFSGLFYLNLWLSSYDLTSREWQRRTSRAMIMWLEDAQSAGIGLDEYGAKVQSLYLEAEWLHTWRWNMWGTRSGLRLVALTTGPEPKDWKLHWGLDADEFAGEFWETVENPPLRIPGGWVDD